MKTYQNKYGRFFENLISLSPAKIEILVRQLSGIYRDKTIDVHPNDETQIYSKLIKFNKSLQLVNPTNKKSLS